VEIAKKALPKKRKRVRERWISNPRSEKRRLVDERGVGSGREAKNELQIEESFSGGEGRCAEGESS